MIDIDPALPRIYEFEVVDGLVKKIMNCQLSEVYVNTKYDKTIGNYYCRVFYIYKSNENILMVCDKIHDSKYLSDEHKEYFEIAEIINKIIYNKKLCLTHHQRFNNFTKIFLQLHSEKIPIRITELDFKKIFKGKEEYIYYNYDRFNVTYLTQEDYENLKWSVRNEY